MDAVMTPQRGTKELTEAVDLILALIEVGVAAEKDGVIGWSDLPLLAKAIPSFGPAVQGLAEVPLEVMNLDNNEAKALIEHVMAKLAITDGKAKAVLDAGLKALLANYALYQAVKA